MRCALRGTGRERLTNLPTMRKRVVPILLLPPTFFSPPTYSPHPPKCVIDTEERQRAIEKRKRAVTMIKYYEGDIFNSSADIICHQVNCQGAFGRGMAGQVKKLFPEVEKSYKILTKAVGQKEARGKDVGAAGAGIGPAGRERRPLVPDCEPLRPGRLWKRRSLH